MHAAPWSAGSQGYANVSHGCTGMSTENAQWFFEHVRPGDIVTGRQLRRRRRWTPFGNGFGDWNLAWEKWQEGSATDAGAQDGGAGGRGGTAPSPGLSVRRPRPERPRGAARSREGPPAGLLRRWTCVDAPSLTEQPRQGAREGDGVDRVRDGRLRTAPGGQPGVLGAADQQQHRGAVGRSRP